MSDTDVEVEHGGDEPTDGPEAETVNDLIDRLLAEFIPEEGDVVPAILAEKFLRQLEETSPEIYDEWLHANDVRFMTEVITYRIRRRRSIARNRAASRAFKDAVDHAGAGDPELLGHFKVRFAVDKDNTQRTVGEMDGDDHKFVATAYDERGNVLKMEAAFHRAVAKVIGKRRTGDVMTEEQYQQLRESITKRQTP